MSTSGNLKGEKNVDFDNFMMIAYILGVNFVGKKYFTSSANSFTFKVEGKHGMRLSQG